MNASHRFACLFAIACSSAAVAGDLNPPGAPAPTMKTIQEAEPRFFISQADVPFTISAPGSYYLSENLRPVGVGGLYVIRVAADNVTLDLRGFTIFGATEVTSAQDGVFLMAVENTTIQNGAIAYCLDDGIDAEAARFVTVASMGVSRSGDDGVVLGDGAVVRNSRLFRNSGSGVNALGVGGVIDNCVAENNVGAGFRTADGMSVTNSAASFNNFGFFASDGATLENCAATDNSGRGFGGGPAIFMHCTASRNAFDGFNTDPGSRLFNCVADQNLGNGFRLPGDSHVRDCSANGNTFNGFAVASQDNRLDSCSAYENGTNGFSITGAGNLLVRSSAGDNTGNDFTFGAGNLIGPIVTSITIGASTNPHANYEQ